MAVPKRRTSKTRKRKRRTHKKIKPKNLNNCDNCGELVMPHRVCVSCGYYKGEKVAEVKGE
ncbi:50S ribosomal protein L32 [Halarsenatibacter silvermanii]|uniref:Large ribosomal subunit protein bL32 n=1 Tax=Halarsenatibacter silvermanii TaxID=321763 RepID=A0A1G9NUA5_9FIRM|nr:50S ribosomal protein L32 [Halarsenatibacter silvermanii]SDL89575.1 large subunit ribosomal protein L32 [Halarsenatibacter silvermanii]